MKGTIIASFAAVLGLVAVYTTMASVPRLVGYGCSGTTGVIFANEEDDFPNCTRIEKYRGY